MHFLFYYSRVLYGMTPWEIPSHPLLIDVEALSPFYKVPLSAWVAFMMVFLYQQTLWLWPLLPLVQFNPALRPPRYYGHLFSGRPGKRPVYFLVKKKKKKKPRQYGQFFLGPLVTVLTGFHCTPMVSLFSPPKRSSSGAKVRPRFRRGVWSSLLALHIGRAALIFPRPPGSSTFYGKLRMGFSIKGIIW